MSDLADRLRCEAMMNAAAPHDLLREAAAELDRLGAICGPTAHYTDADWANWVFEKMAREAAMAGAAFAPPSIRALNGSMVEAGNALHDAQGYWERHLQATGGR